MKRALSDPGKADKVMLKGKLNTAFTKVIIITPGVWGENHEYESQSKIPFVTGHKPLTMFPTSLFCSTSSSSRSSLGAFLDCLCLLPSLI